MNNKNEFEFGPWKSYKTTLDHSPMLGIRDNAGMVALIPVNKSFPDICAERERNAKLILAAQDLLEALKAIVKFLSDQDDEGMIEHTKQMEDARAAIAKAAT